MNIEADDTPDQPDGHPETDRSQEQLLHKLCADIGCKFGDALGFLEWAEDNYFPPARDYEAARKLLSKYRLAMQVLVSYQDNQSRERALRMSTRIMALALGFTTAAGADNPTDVGKAVGVSKQTVGKCLDIFQKKLGLEPTPSQRAADSRKNMKLARTKQLKK